MTEASGRFDEVNARFDQIGEQITELRQELTEQRGNILTLQMVSSQLLEMVRIQQQNAEADRQSFQAEIRRIWEYLLDQRGNGHGG